MKSLKEQLCLFVFLQGTDEVASAKHGKKCKQICKGNLCKENIATLKAMQGGLNHVSCNA